jgi:hypothetical protein
MNAYAFRLLRYAPNRLSEEFYNVAVLLYDESGQLLDARFAPNFNRFRCHPLSDLPMLAALREEFESRRLEGAGFTGYVESLTRHLSQTLQLSGSRSFLAEDWLPEIERLSRTYLETPRRSEVRPAGPPSGARRWIRRRLRETFEMYHLLDRLETDIPVGSYVSPRFSFHLDYGYRPDDHTRYVQALSAHHGLSGAARLCFVFDRVRAQTEAALTAVADDSLPEDTRSLLESSRIRWWPVSKLDALAVTIREELRV